MNSYIAGVLIEINVNLHEQNLK